MANTNGKLNKVISRIFFLACGELFQVSGRVRTIRDRQSLEKGKTRARPTPLGMEKCVGIKILNIIRALSYRYGRGNKIEKELYKIREIGLDCEDSRLWALTFYRISVAYAIL